MVYEVKPHDEEPNVLVGLRIFLAGTIDMGKSVDWQHGFINWLKDWSKNNLNATYIVYNPRRDKWEGFDDDKKELDYQIKWELNHLEASDMIIMNILGDSKSPITLLELGLFAKSGKLTVCCESEFYRYDNVKTVCDRYSVEMFNSLNECFKTKRII